MRAGGASAYNKCRRPIHGPKDAAAHGFGFLDDVYAMTIALDPWLTDETASLGLLENETFGL
jgi:hypothetical protein